MILALLFVDLLLALCKEERRLSASACELGFLRATALDKVWDDSGSGANHDFSCWRPKSITRGSYTYKPLGDVAHRSHGQMTGGQILVAGDVRSPIGFTKVWDDAGSGADDDISVWLPQDPPGYRCLGHVGSQTFLSPPSTDLFACIPEACVNESGPVGENIWTDAGSGAEKDFSVWALPIGNGYFVSYDQHDRKGVHTVEDLLISQHCFGAGNTLEEPCTTIASEALCSARCLFQDNNCIPRSDTCNSNYNLAASILSSNSHAASSRPNISCMAKGCKWELIEKFAPILQFDEKAKGNCFPGNAGEHYNMRKSGIAEQVCNNDPGSMSRGEVETYFEYDECSSGGSKVEVIMYWFWYGYQPPCIDNFIITAGDHPGDWERVVVLLVNGELKRVMFYQHAGWYSVGDYYLKGSHPVVYVGKYSHGSYHDPGGQQDGMGLECMYFSDTRNPGLEPHELQTWKNLVFLDYVNGPEWMLPSANVHYFEGVSPPGQRGTKLCELKACDGTDDFWEGKCIGMVCGCSKSCLNNQAKFSDIRSLSTVCPSKPQYCFTGMECLVDFYGMMVGGVVGARFPSFVIVLRVVALLSNALS